MALVVKNLPANAGDIRVVTLIPRLGRSTGGGHGNPFQYSCLENPIERGGWWATILKQLSTVQACIVSKFPIHTLKEYQYMKYIHPGDYSEEKPDSISGGSV